MSNLIKNPVYDEYVNLDLVTNIRLCEYNYLIEFTFTNDSKVEWKFLEDQFNKYLNWFDIYIAKCPEI